MNSRKTFQTILFDFDGTIVDTAPGIIACFRRIMGKKESASWTDKDIRALIGTPLRTILQKLLASSDTEVIEKAVTAFRSLYPKTGLHMYRVYPGMKKLLKFLVKKRARLYIVSNKFETFIHPILKESNLDSYVSGVIGAGKNDPPNKSALVARCITRYRIDPKTTAIVGDSPGDIIAGKKNGLYTVGVTFGYGAREDLERAGADAIVPTASLLAQLLL